MLKMYCDGSLIWEAGTNDEQHMAKDPILVDELWKIPTLKFSIPKTNVAFRNINPVMSRVWVEENGEIIFYGRPLTVERTFGLQENVVCENALGFLGDTYTYSSDSPGKTGANPLIFLYDVILNGWTGTGGYNSQCDPGNQIQVGTGYERAGSRSAQLKMKDGRSALDFVWQLAKNYPSTVWISWAKVNGDIVSYLNFAECALMESAPLTPDDGQQILFGRNLRDIDEDIDATNIFTHIRAYDTTHSIWYDYEQAAHVAAYGTIKIGKDFDTSGYSDGSVGRQQEAEKYYNANAFPVVTRSVKAVDAVDFGATVNRFRVGFYYDVISAPHGINERMICQKITRNLDKPGRSTYEFGQVKKTLTGRLVK